MITFSFLEWTLHKISIERNQNVFSSFNRARKFKTKFSDVRLCKGVKPKSTKHSEFEVDNEVSRLMQIGLNQKKRETN